ncbi:hypothetical protein [Chitinophaga nivalis]|uniref:Glycosyltransferase RgtA/B/C/D-like domain-containing protein n=1 Tax=Chitinophaga nivalis TaxID=2991709 RepID=A0ABT3IKW7_9BACT|nr:hypothetical protein [Chitinophaga nivalis]MCW3465703.1 hypothetical protein [Chitinophaga nivalis]MCW3484606.1 hypothetical protein [Chitinophaga nivalis]
MSFTTARKWAMLEVIIIVALALVPLFVTFPYRVNIFLSWEGAYRLSSGQIPYKDFGLPLGYGYWIIPALFFKIFGPQMITLVKAQVFINIMAGLAFRSILKSLGATSGVRLLSVLVFALSYSFSNFWPWYNHTVIVYELVGLSFLLRAIFAEQVRSRFLWLAVAALFVFLSLFTKQDGGGMAFMLCLGLLTYNSAVTRRWWDVPVFAAMYIAIALLFILPLMPSFGYWFNHGQPPHSSRLAMNDFTDEIMGNSNWIKGYVVLAALCVAARVKQWSTWILQRQEVLFVLVTVGILGEAAIFQVTSYTPPDNNIFFHSFAFAFIATYLCELLQVNINQGKALLGAAFLVLFWWSGTWWKYVGRFTDRLFPAQELLGISDPTKENVVSRRNYILNYDSTDVPVAKWVYTDLPVFRKIYMPASTVKGMERVLALPVVREKKEGIKVLNMTELTPLAVVMPYKLETGSDYPLWYHLGVGMFNKQLTAFTQKVQQHHYDLVLYEYAPTLNNFYPFALREELRQNYQLVDSFLAPRRPTNAVIEVYVKP